MHHASLPGRLLMIGCGSIGQGVLPLILRHIDIPAERISVITADARGADVAGRYDIAFDIHPLTRKNYRDVLTPRLRPGDVLLNLSVDVSSLDLVALCQSLGVLYLDTCIEPWPGGYTDPSLTPSQRSNYALREAALELARHTIGGPTAVLTHGANPGLVSHLVKRALLDVARDAGLPAAPSSRDGWARLAWQLGVRTIHVAERDTQVANGAKQPGEFVNTWSIDGFVGEGCQPAELGWGSHEKALPPDGRHHAFGDNAAIYLERPGASTKVRSWTPLAGPIHGWLITHSESISIADYLTIREGGREEGAVAYRPTVHYAYHPCDDAVLSLHELAGRNWSIQPRQRLLMDEIVAGADELGVLLMGHARGAYWLGSRLGIEEARRLAPHNNATSLQVTATVLAGLVWALENPRRGIVEADEIDHARVLEIARPYLGEVVGIYSDWTPLSDRGTLFGEALDTEDPWQFSNFRVR